jgi:hypothetical protein
MLTSTANAHRPMAARPGPASVQLNVLRSATSLGTPLTID